MKKPSLPKGTRDFLPKQVVQRNYLFDTIKRVFLKYGYQQIETPAMESLSTLMGKYGDEGDQLLFKVLNNGDFLAKINDEQWQSKDTQIILPKLSKRGLRYDLTVPFARYVVMNQNELAFPFKRFAMQPVWRADRPQKGRYQEFYQCDVDVVGSDSLIYEAELVQIYDEVFRDLGIKVAIRLNNRKILAGIAEVCGIHDQFVDMAVAIDKLDKIGAEGVSQEMVSRGIAQEQAMHVLELLKSSNLEALKEELNNSEIGLKGIQELERITSLINMHALSNTIEIDLTLARGLGYYTGAIFEVEALDVKMGSIGGGGRYDDLTANFGLKGMSGVGISFGAERIYDVMEELDLFDKSITPGADAIFISMTPEALDQAFQYTTMLRAKGIAVELYPEAAKMKKQMKYADARNMSFALILGEDELKANKIMVKNLRSGEQQLMDIEQLTISLT